MPTAVVIDGELLLRRFSSSFAGLNAESPDDIAIGVTSIATWHLAFRLGPHSMLSAIERHRFQPEESEHLNRIFFYDCAPLMKRVHRPVSKQSLDLAKTPSAIFLQAVHKRFQGVCKVALRLGRLNDDFLWRLKLDALKRWLADTALFRPADEDFEMDVTQKGVDIRLGLDVSSMAFKKQVDQIIIVAADADFVPAAKLDRREGIDVVADHMGNHTASDLLQHVDGVRRCRIGEQPGTADDGR